MILFDMNFEYYIFWKTACFIRDGIRLHLKFCTVPWDIRIIVMRALAGLRLCTTGWDPPIISVPHFRLQIRRGVVGGSCNLRVAKLKFYKLDAGTVIGQSVPTGPRRFRDSW